MATLRELAKVQEQKLGQKDVAFLGYCRALPLMPQDDALREEIERLADETGSYEELAAVYEEVADGVPRGPLAERMYLTLARVYDQKLDDSEAAEKELRKILEFDPTNETALERLAKMFARRGQNKEYVVSLEQKLEATPSLEKRKEILREIARVWSRDARRSPRGRERPDARARARARSRHPVRPGRAAEEGRQLHRGGLDAACACATWRPRPRSARACRSRWRWSTSASCSTTRRPSRATARRWSSTRPTWRRWSRSSGCTRSSIGPPSCSRSTSGSSSSPATTASGCAFSSRARPSGRSATRTWPTPTPASAPRWRSTRRTSRPSRPWSGCARPKDGGTSSSAWSIATSSCSPTPRRRPSCAWSWATSSTSSSRRWTARSPPTTRRWS